MKKLLFVFVVALLAQMAFAQSIAVIDFAKVFDSDYVKNSYSALQKQEADIKQELTIRQANVYLSENEMEDLVKLILTKGDAAKIKELQDNNTKRYDELQTLAQTRVLNDTQKARLSELNALEKKSKTNLQGKIDAYSKTFEASVSAKEAEVRSTVVDVCKKIAQEKSYSIVVEKSAVIYGGVDITNDVIKQLPAVK